MDRERLNRGDSHNKTYTVSKNTKHFCFGAGFLIWFLVSSAAAQELPPQAQDTAQRISPEEIAARREAARILAERTARQLKPNTRTAAATASGDSAAGSIGGIATPESVKVSSGGAATQSIPIVVPPGTAGVQPNLSFNYNSQGENSLLGVGWSVSGLPVIHRCPRTVAQDNFRGAVNYDANDRFCLDGQRLMAISGVYGANLTEYRTEVDSFLKIISYGTAGNGPSYFIVKTKGGETMELGNTADSKIEAQGKTSVRVWALNKLYDVKGNYLTVTYAEDSTNGEYRPTQIDYTGNVAGGLTPSRKAVFAYNENGVIRADQTPQWVGGSKILTTKLLTSVKTYVGATLVRDYRVEYETGTATLRSRLKRIKECDANGNCLPANTPSSQPAWQFTWQEGGDGTYQIIPSSTFNNNDLNGSYIWTGDFNGDGKSDMLTTVGLTLWTWFSNGDGTFQKTSTPIGAGQMNGLYIWIGDYNGDGKDDFASIYGLTLFTYLSNGNGTYQIVTQAISPGQFDGNPTWVGDFNGDGRTDLISWYGWKFYSYFSNGDGTYQVVASGTFNSGEILLQYLRTGDFNGDGKIDIVTVVGYNLYTYFSNGDGTFQKVLMAQPGTTNPSEWQIGDFNGDGKSDIANHNWFPGNEEDPAVRSIVTYFSKGDGTYDMVSHVVPDYWSTYGLRVGDFNGDGKADLISGDAENGSYITTLLSNGDGAFRLVQQSLTYLDWLIWFGDFNGDGKMEVITPSGYQLFIYNPVGAYPDLVTNITNPFGGTNSMTYLPLTNNAVYAKDTGALAAVYPNVDLQHALYVVALLNTSDGLGTTYSRNYAYGGAKAHHLGRGNLGFRWMVEIDVNANSKTSTFYNQSFPLTGLPSFVEYDRNNDGAPFKETLHEYWNLNAYPTTAPTVSFVAPKQVDIVEWDGSSTTTRTIRRQFGYDSAANGNLTSTYHFGDINVSGDEREETTDWVVDSANWLHRSKSLRLKDGSGNVVREKWLYYDNQAHGVLGSAGLVTKEENNAGGGMGHGDNPVFLYTYDTGTGVKTNVRDPRQCDTTTTYESTKTFPQTVAICSNVSALNFVTSYVHDARFGVVTSMTEPYQAGDSPLPTTNYEYDGFGRLTKEIGPLDGGSYYGTASHYYLDWGNPYAQRVLIYRTEEHGTGNALWSLEYFDGLGRSRVTQKEGPDTSTTGNTIVSVMAFDSRNLTTVQSAPFLINSSWAPLETPKYDFFTYDPLGRATQITHPDSTYASKLYQRGVVTLTDERGKITKRHFDGLEQLTKVQEFNSSSTYDTVYTRNAAGSLKTVANTLSHLTKIDYDMLGRKRAMCDPNMGTPSNVASCTTSTTGAWVYTYNQAGDLLTQKDAKNQTLTFTYDEIGRPKTKKQGTTTIASWTYDNPAVMFSKGRVTQVVDLPASQNTISNFSYNVLGRVTQSQRVLVGVTHTMAQTYDALGRIKTETFPSPDNETVTYNYNEAGWIKSVTNYISDVQYNGRGQKTSLTYANNLTTTWSYDANRFWETNRTTSGNQQNLTYGRDNNGNIISIADNLGGSAGRTFQYDDLNRLTYAQGNFGANQTPKTCNYSYSAIGNLIDKCGAVLSYNDTMHPSAVTNNSLTGKNYSYDANGNMITRGTQTLVWDIENRVTSVSISGGGSTLMEYDYTGMRVKKNAPTGITLYPFKGYEIDPNSTISKFIKIGNESFASKKRTSGGLITQYFYHNDHLGSVNVITDITGARAQRNEYEPWGEVSRSEGATPGSSPTVDLNHRFTGQELDPETGLHYYGGRYYDQEIGRFASPDPFVQEPDNPQNLNRYTYVLDNPQNYVDPNGHFFWIPAIVSAVIGAIAAVLPELFIIDGVLTALGTFAQAAIVASNIASTGMLTADLMRKAELSNLHNSRNVAAQQQNNIQKARPLPRQGDAPLDYGLTADTTESLVNRIGFREDTNGIPTLQVNVGRSIVNLFKWAFGRGGKPVAKPKSVVKPRPTDGQIKKFEKQLEEHGRESLEKSKKSLEKNLEEHRRELEIYRERGGHTSSVEREIRNFEREVEAINEILRRHPQ